MLKTKTEIVSNYLICIIPGVKGLILDTNNNPVVDASLTIVGREFAKFRSNSDGAYFRLLMPGTYQIEVSYAFIFPTKNISLYCKGIRIIYMSVRCILHFYPTFI